MDVLVRWKNGTHNVVDSSELKTVNCKEIKLGCSVKMLYKRRWYYGTVLDVESKCEVTSSDSEDNTPLSKLKNVTTREIVI